MATGLTLEQLQKMGAKPVERLGGGLTLAQLQAEQNKEFQSQKAPGVTFQSKPTDTPLQSGIKTLGNVPSSAINFGKGLIEFFNPVNTVKTAQNIGTTLADSQGVSLGDVVKELPSATYEVLIPQFFKSLFKGDVEGAKKVITEDPVGQLAPVLLVMRGVAEKAGVGTQFDKVMTDVTKTATKPITKTATGLGKLTTNTLGVTTGAGGEAIRTALKGGKEFTDALRGKTSMQNVLQESQDAVSKLIETRKQEYQAKLSDIRNMPQSLDISPVYKTLQDNLKSFNVKPINGEIIDKSFERSVLQNDKPAQAIFKTVYDNLKTYGSQPGDRTPIALDTLKRSLSDLYSDNSSVRSFTQSMTSSVNSILKKNVPKYEEMTRQYSDYSNLLKDIKQNLAVGGKAAEGTAMTRLTNALKQNNELRLEVLKELEKTTGVNLKDKIAGAALSDAIPRGFIGKGIDLYSLANIFRGIFSPQVFMQMILTSPRLVGELMNALGIGARGAWKIIKPLNESPMLFFSPEKQKAFETKLQKTPIGLSLKDVSKTPLSNLKVASEIVPKKEVVLKDVNGNKFNVKDGEKLTIYEKGSNFLVNNKLINKGQYENLKGQSSSLEAKEFAPELKQTEETVIGGEQAFSESDIVWKKTIKKGGKNDLLEKYDVFNGTLGDRKFLIEANDDGFYVAELDKQLGRQVRTYTDAVEEINRYLKAEAKPTKYSSYTLPGGKNYKEILIKAPMKKVNQPEIKWEQRVPGEWHTEVNGRKFGMLQESNGVYVYEDGGVLGRQVNNFTDAKQIIKDTLVKPATADFRSSHWSEPNVISHIRLNERTYNGKKVAFMEELQSDWAREGRSNGFISGEKLPQAEFDALSKKINDATAKYRGEQNPIPKAIKDGSITQADIDRMAILNDLKYEPNKGVPNNPLLKNWQELSIKRALKEAVDNKAEYFSWINGEQTAARYNLSKQVDSIEWGKSGTVGDKKIYIKPKNATEAIVVRIEKDGTIIEGGESNWKGKKIDEAIGKGLGEKIMNSPTGDISGEGLNVGGEWAKNLYDKQVKNIVESLTGKKVEMLDMGLAIDKRATKWRITKQKGFEMFADTDIILDESNIQVGDTVANLGSRIEDIKDTDKYVITDILGNGKFKAVPKNQILRKQGESFESAIERGNLKKVLESEKETFDISTNKSTQQGIKLTPDVVAIVKGEKPIVSKPKTTLGMETAIPLIFGVLMTGKTLSNFNKKE